VSKRIGKDELKLVCIGGYARREDDILFGQQSVISRTRYRVAKGADYLL